MSYKFPKMLYFKDEGSLLKLPPEEEVLEVTLENWQDREDNIKKVLDSLRSRFEFKNEEYIGYFLSVNQFLIPVLKDCHDNIKKFFTNGESLLLDLLHDPTDDIEKIIISIITALSPKKAIGLLRKFFKEWWINHPLEVRKNIIIDVDTS